MSQLKLEYEILVSGVYPFEGTFEKCGFKVVKKEIDKSILKNLMDKSVVYLSPFIGLCSYPDQTGKAVYLTLQKDDFIEIDYDNRKEYDVEYTNDYIERLNIFDNIELLEKMMVLEVNNDIKFPIKMVKVYDPDGNYITQLGDFMKLNVPSLLNNDQDQGLEVIKRQNNRLSSGISYEKVAELASSNVFFNNALTIYHSSFSVSDHIVGFILLVTALESLLSLSTYSKTKNCESCGQTQYKIRSTVSKNVSLILMDQDGTIEKKLKKLYDKRSQFLHSGKRNISKQDEQEAQEYVRKVLLMYWFISINKSTYEHKDIIAEIQKDEYRENLLLQNFLVALGNTSFDEQRSKMLKDIWHYISGNE